MGSERTASDQYTDVMTVVRSLLLSAKRWRIILSVYVFQLILALTLGLQVYQVIEASIGDSMSLDRLIHGMDYTVLQDLLHIHGSSLSPLVGKVRWYILAYMVFSAFINGGIWYAISRVDTHAQWSRFWQGGAQYFGIFFGLGLIMNLLFLIWTVLVWAWYVTSFINMMEAWFSDRHIVWLGLLLMLVWIHGVSLLFLAGSYARSILVTQTTGIFISFGRGMMYAIRRYFGMLPGLYLYALILFLLYFLIVFLESTIGIKSTGLIFLFFMLQQGIVISKILHRVGVYQYIYSDYLTVIAGDQSDAPLPFLTDKKPIQSRTS